MYPVQQIWAHDFVGISSFKGMVILPDFINKQYSPFSQTDIQKIYTPSTIVELFNGSPKQMPYIYDPNQIKIYFKDGLIQS